MRRQNAMVGLIIIGILTRMSFSSIVHFILPSDVYDKRFVGVGCVEESGREKKVD
jgi:hypothetical protein